MSTLHATLSASGSKKWLNCPASIELEKLFPETTSSFAEEGTIAHEVGEILTDKLFSRFILDGTKVIDLDDKLDYERYLELKESYSSKVDDFTEMYECCVDYANYIMGRYTELRESDKTVELHLEERLDYSLYAKDGFGTGDALIVTEKHIEVIDLKYGKGVKVDVENNTQLMLYALGALTLYNMLDTVETVTLTIFQPRLDNISSWTVDVNTIYEFGEKTVKPISDLITQGKGVPCAGKHCADGFCKARAKCKEYADYILSLSEYKFVNPRLISDEDIASILEIGENVNKWVATVKSYAQDRLLQGEPIPGLKIVEGRSNRSFTDTTKVIEVLKEYDDSKEYEVVSLKSITDLEKMIGKKKFNELLQGYIIKPTGAPTVVPESDKRVAINSIQSDFADLELDKE